MIGEVAVDWQRRTSWTELCTSITEGTESHIDGNEPVPAVSGRFVLGTPDDRGAPLIFRTYFPPGKSIPVHSHRVNYSEWILDGTREITRKWYRAGDVQVATAGTFYGPLVAGPSGALVLAIFASQEYIPITVDEARATGIGEEKFFEKTNWENLLDRGDLVGGGVNAAYVVGRPDDEASPVVVKSFVPPGVEVAVHEHRGPYAQIVMAGTLTRDGDEYRAGDIRIAAPVADEGPFVAGPMGADLFTVFANGRALPAHAKVVA